MVTMCNFIHRESLRGRSSEPLSEAIGNGLTPTIASIHPGCCNAAPRRPQAVQRRFWRRTLLEASDPHRMTNGARRDRDFVLTRLASGSQSFTASPEPR
jgi:hypothetical protein